MKYEIILFDVDDTLFDFVKSEKLALHKAFAEFGLPTGLANFEADYQEISKVLWGDLEQGHISITDLGIERFRRLFFLHELEINAEAFSCAYLEYLGKKTHLVKGAVELCGKLSCYRMAIITNGFTDVQKSRIEGSPLSNMFEHIIISEEVGFQKPEKEIFDYAFSKLQIKDKGKVLIVGDSLTSDIRGGMNYGIDTCWFNPNHKENNSEIEPTYEIHELADLLKIVG
ncbi:YjjG family noncanonical pyrimidine nucleotidase [Sporosarcina jiandibaonis]|uniref:YjjG family noncanonical pyrimidine nucleotidase n=1 Tax=Sporosarcina jiandibaonis TaxID=2715535 RepID=UPI00155756C5|nr:YjjG family noncanonical pyrimidine nucleotidase [Sporosarcina jiandibaonis]